MNLPKLKGTEKQVAWAERIRKYFIDRLENFTDDPENIEDFNILYDTNLTKEDIDKIINYIAKQDEATYFIDNRDLNIYKLMKAEMENALKEEEAEKEEEIAVEAKTETTVRPEEPEQTRWIKRRASGKYEGWLAISWAGFDNDLYKKARSLPGSRWSSPNVVVKVDHYREVEEFAKLYGFKFSDGAKRAIEAYKKAQEIREAEEKR